MGGSAGKGFTGGNGHGDAGGEAGLSALGITRKDGEASLADELVDDETVFLVFGCEGAEEVRNLLVRFGVIQ